MADGQRDVHWTAIGRILGPLMPVGEVTVGKVKIFPAAWASPEKLKRLPKGFLPAANVSIEDEDSGEEVDSLSMSAPNPSITSRWIFTIDFDAADVDEAEGIAGDLLTEALSALHLDADEPYFADVLRLEEPDYGYMMSVATVGRAPELRELAADQVESAKTLLPLLSATKAGRTATQHIRRAVSLQRAAAVVPELGPSVLHNYFMAIEAISDAVTRELRDSMGEELQRKLIDAVAQVRHELQQEASNERAVEIVREAGRRFSRIQFHYADLKIEMAGKTLRLEQSSLDEAKRFSRFRNEYLGHPRSEVPDAEISHWFKDELAFRLSNAYLRAYVSNR